MKIKDKLALAFTLLISVILLFLNLYIYVLFKNIQQDNFYEILRNRATIIGTVILESDEKSKKNILPFEEKFLQTLPDESILVYNEDNNLKYLGGKDKLSYNKWFLDRIRAMDEIRFGNNTKLALGINYKDNEGDFIIIVSAYDASGNRALHQLMNVLLIGYISSVIILIFAGRYFASIMLRPVSVITEQANRISETNLHNRLDTGNGKDELAQLSLTINKMLERLEISFDAQKSFVSNASHELRTPLTSIIGNIEVILSKERSKEEYTSVLKMLLSEAEKLEQLTNGLLQLAQSNMDFESPTKENININELINEVLIEYKTRNPYSQVQFKNYPIVNGKPLYIKGQRRLLHNTLLNIIDNAVKFSENQLVEIYAFENEADVTIEVQDKGIGIYPEDLKHVTEPFYRSVNARKFKGTGIGLALAQSIMHLHHGKLEISSEPEKGTRVQMLFSKEDNSFF